jgi:hypothetical protein
MLLSPATLFLFGLSLSAQVLAQSCFDLQVIAPITNNPWYGQYLSIDGSSNATNYTTSLGYSYTILSAPTDLTSTYVFQNVTAANAPGSPPKFLPLYPNNTASAPIRWFSSFADADADSVQLGCRAVQVPMGLGFPIEYWLACKAGLNDISFNICGGELYGALYVGTQLPGCTQVEFIVSFAGCPATTTTAKKGKPTKRA